MRTSGHYLFHEEQNFRKSWVLLPAILLSVVMMGIMGYGMYHQLYLGKPFGSNPAPDGVLIGFSVFIILLVCSVALLILTLTLITEIREDGFYYRFPVLINRFRSVRKEEIEHYEIGKYNPIGDFGGWGIRTGFGKRKAYNVSGNIGVKLYLKNGKMILFGTRQPDDMKKAMDRMMGLNKA